MRNLLYHYTNQNALISILHQKSVWASSACFLNDSLEYNYALSLMMQLAQDDLRASDSETAYGCFLKHVVQFFDHPHWPHIFVFSMCEDGDLLGMWRGYGSGSNGFAIGLERKALEAVAAREGYELVQCVYEVEAQRALLREEVEELRRRFLDPVDGHGVEAQNFGVNLVTQDFGAWFLRVAARIKHRKFHEEREWRLISGPMTMKAADSEGRVRVGDTTIHHRPGRSTLVPYKIIAFGEPTEEDPGPIREIVVGPTAERELAMGAALTLVGQANVHAGVRMSEVPYRTW